MVLNKVDLLPYVSFDVKQARRNAQRVHPGIEIVELSCTTGAGLEQWRTWLRKKQLRVCEQPAGCA